MNRQEEKDLYPSEPFGHCDIGTKMEVCSKCPNFPAKCAYQSKESFKERYKKFTEQMRFKITYNGVDAIEKDLRNKNLITEEITVDYFELT